MSLVFKLLPVEFSITCHQKLRINAPSRCLVRIYSTNKENYQTSLILSLVEITLCLFFLWDECGRGKKKLFITVILLKYEWQQPNPNVNQVRAKLREISLNQRDLVPILRWISWKKGLQRKKILQEQMESPWWKSLKIDYSCSCEALGTIFGLYDNSRFLPGLSKDKIYLLSQQKFRKTSKCWNKREVKTY